MAYKKGRSEKKTDWLGNTYIQHYDSKGNKSGKSVPKEGFFGNKYTQHYDSKGDKRGKSEKKEGFWGNKYTQKYDSEGNKSGRSEKKEGFFGNKYTQHYDAKGNKTDRSVRKEGFWGNQYVERYSDKPESNSHETTSRSKSASNSTSIGIPRSDGTSSSVPGEWQSTSPSRNKTKSFSGSGWIIAIIAIIMGAWFAASANRATNPSSPHAADEVIAPPPALVVATGACPFEGCQLGKWIARETIAVYEHPGGLLKQKLRPGETVYATSAEVRAVPRKAVITKTYKSDEEHGLKVGNQIYVLYPIGEGAVAVWNEGRIVHGSLDLDFRYAESIESRPLQWSWWVQVRLADGTTGWLQNPQGHLEGMDAFG